MGLTSKSIDILKPLIEKYTPKSVCDLGAQNIYCDRVLHGNNPVDHMMESKKWVERLGIENLYRPSVNGERWQAPYASKLWERCGIEYLCVDLQELNNAIPWDLSEPLRTTQEFDFVMDYGTSEHVKDHFQCFQNIHDLTKIGGIIIHENPKTENWKGHCYHYLTKEFYIELAEKSGYNILLLEEWPAMGNTTDGWNIICVLQKISETFPKRKDYPKTYNK